MQYIVQTIECGGTFHTEYNYEPEIIEDEPEAEYPLVCGSCDHFRVWGGCALNGFKRSSTSLACHEVEVTCPF